MAVTSRDVAQLAGVSVATVSRIFTKNSSVKEKNRKKVLEAAKQLNYTPNHIARSLKSNKSNTIGLIVPYIMNPYYLQSAAIIANEFEKHNYKLLLAFLDKSDEDETSATEKEYNLIKSLIAAQVDAIMFTPDFMNRKLPNLFADSTIYPLQIHTSLYRNIDSIRNNDIKATAFLAQYLIDRGHRDIMFINGGIRTKGKLKRTLHDEGKKKGIVSALRKNGIPVKPAMFILADDQGSNITPVEQAILTAKPTAIIIQSHLKIMILGILKKHEIHFPRDISIIGYDDDPLSEYLGITAMGHNIEFISKEMSRCVLDHLSKRTQGKEESKSPRHQLVDTVFIERSSVSSLV
jgi:DNA-binding LacI/PurR family transcriptional regulator